MREKKERENDKEKEEKRRKKRTRLKIRLEPFLATLGVEQCREYSSLALQ